MSQEWHTIHQTSSTVLNSLKIPVYHDDFYEFGVSHEHMLHRKRCRRQQKQTYASAARPHSSHGGIVCHDCKGGAARGWNGHPSALAGGGAYRNDSGRDRWTTWGVIRSRRQSAAGPAYQSGELEPGQGDHRRETSGCIRAVTPLPRCTFHGSTVSTAQLGVRLHAPASQVLDQVPAQRGAADVTPTCATSHARSTMQTTQGSPSILGIPLLATDHPALNGSNTSHATIVHHGLTRTSPPPAPPPPLPRLPRLPLLSNTLLILPTCIIFSKSLHYIILLMDWKNNIFYLSIGRTRSCDIPGNLRGPQGTGAPVWGL